MYKFILLPIDVSEIEQGRRLINFAQQLSGEGTRIRLLNIVADIPVFVAAQVPNEVFRTAMINAKTELEGLISAAGIEAEAEVKSGKPGATIVSCADEYAVDLIIIGSHKPGLQDYFLGSTAERVVRYAPCSVLVVR